MSKYNTNLAAEFWVLSSLHRLGLLTLGNRKAVDIILEAPGGRFLTVEVKGVEGKHDWPADNIRLGDSQLHFFRIPPRGSWRPLHSHNV